MTSIIHSKSATKIVAPCDFPTVPLLTVVEELEDNHVLKASAVTATGNDVLRRYESHRKLSWPILPLVYQHQES